jgi:outer membrane protein assembly factor BamB
LLFTGCSTDSKITGKRELFLPNPNNVVIDQGAAKRKVALPVEQVREWKQDGISGNNVLVNAKFDVKKAKLLWKERVGKEEGENDKLISNIVAKGGVLFAGNVNGDVFALDLRTRKVLWKTNVGKNGIAKIGGVGLLDDGSIITTTADGNVHQIDSITGKIKKAKNIGGTIRSAPRIWHDKIFVQTNSNELAMLSRDLKILWRRGELPEDIVFLGNSSPTTDGGIVIGAYSTGEYRAYDVLSGNECWEDFMVPSAQCESTATMLHICASPVISDGLAFVFGHGGRLVANDIVSGKRIWDLDISGLSTPAVVGDWIFVTDWESRIFCIEKLTGKVKWRTHIPEDRYGNIAANWTKPIIAGNTVIVATNAGLVVFFDVNSGKVERIIKTTLWAPSSAIVVNEVLYILSGDGSVYAFG